MKPILTNLEHLAVALIISEALLAYNIPLRPTYHQSLAIPLRQPYQRGVNQNSNKKSNLYTGPVYTQSAPGTHTHTQDSDFDFFR